MVCVSIFIDFESFMVYPMFNFFKFNFILEIKAETANKLHGIYNIDYKIVCGQYILYWLKIWIILSKYNKIQRKNNHNN